MAETWEQTKARLSKQGINLQTDIVVVAPPKPPTPIKYEGVEPPVKRFNIHKRSLPIGNPPLDKIVVFAVTKAEAAWWIDHVLKCKAYQDDSDDSKTLIYYDVIPVGATPKERSIFYNPGPLTVPEGEKYFETVKPAEIETEVDWK